MGQQSSARQLVVIMFTDMVGYAALVQRDEALALQLVQRQREFVRALLPRFGGREVEVIGDAFLIEFGSALRAAECAIALQQRINTASADAPEAERFSIRIGLHLGDIERPGKGVFGDSVNIAARVQEQAPHGGIAVSAPVHDQIRNKLAAPFRPLGPTALKNIERPVELFVLDADAIRALPPPKAEAATRPRFVTPSLKLGLLSGGVMALALLLWLGARLTVSFRESAAATPSVAVLPFVNLSDDKQNEYFADGMHESIISHLARVKDLKIISRTSVMEYKDKTRNLREIGQALGVAHIVEGSVQRVGNRVRVSAQLIEAATDRHLWAETYDRDLADVFAIQSEVAERVVVAVNATLTPEEKGRIEQRPTANAEAYDLYLRAEELERQPSSSGEMRLRIQALLEQAIGLDPSFALAHAALGRNHIRLYRGGTDPTARRRDQALAAAETALRLQPDLAEGHVAMGMYFYMGFRDYEQALKEFDEALSRSPNSAEAHEFVGYIQRRRGLWNSAITSLNRAVELDPRNSIPVVALGQTYVALRQYATAAAVYEKAVTLAPGDVRLRVMPAFTHFLWQGDLEPLRKTLAGIPPGVDPDQTASTWRVTLALWEGRYAEAISFLTAFPDDGLVYRTAGFEAPKDFYLGQAFVALGDTAKARPYFMRSRVRLQAYIVQQPESPNLADLHAALGLTQAYLGERLEAMRNAERAQELLPISRDAVYEPAIAQMAADIHLRLGDHDRALTELEPLLKTPGGPHAHELRRDPEWKPLWNDPRFKKLIAENLPKE